jgi:Beta-lactamase
VTHLGSATLKPGFLKAETIAALQTPTHLVSGAFTTYALGWTVSSVQLAGEPARMVSHRGSPAGGYVSLLTFPDLGLAVAAAANVAILLSGERLRDLKSERVNAAGIHRHCRRGPARPELAVEVALPPGTASTHRRCQLDRSVRDRVRSLLRFPL